jgi:hypothetical protein
MSRAMRQPSSEDTIEYIESYIEDQSVKVKAGMVKMGKRLKKMKRALKIREEKMEEI